MVELLADYQFYTVPPTSSARRPQRRHRRQRDGVPDHTASDRLRFGASFLRLLQFDVDRGEMIVDTYSPFLDNFGATEYDIRQDGSQTKPRYNGSEDNLTLPVDLTSRKTSFATESLAAYVPGGVIGADEVTADGTATVTWSGLAPASSYAWIVSARSRDGGVAVAQPAVFRTAKAQPTVTATAAAVDWGTAATVTVRVAAGAWPATGTVQLKEGDTVRGSTTLVDGSASFTLPKGLAVGSHPLTVSYPGQRRVRGGAGQRHRHRQRATAVERVEGLQRQGHRQLPGQGLPGVLVHPEPEAGRPHRSLAGAGDERGGCHRLDAVANLHGRRCRGPSGQGLQSPVVHPQSGTG